MEYAGAIIVILVGAALVLTRNIYAKFILSFLHRIPVVSEHELGVIRFLTWIAVIFGALFLIYGLFMASNVAVTLSQRG